MKSYTNNTLGQTVTLEVPENEAEFNQLADGDPSACLDNAIKQVIYGNWNSNFRRKFCEALEAETGEPRGSKQEGEGDKAKTVYTEKEMAYKNRLLAEGHIDEEALGLLANTVAKEIPFDPKPATRTKKPPAEVQKTLKSILAGVDSGETDEATVSGKLAAALGIEDFSAQFGDFSEASVTAALLAIKKKRDEEAQSEFV